MTRFKGFVRSSHIPATLKDLSQFDNKILSLINFYPEISELKTSVDLNGIYPVGTVEVGRVSHLFEIDDLSVKVTVSFTNIKTCSELVLSYKLKNDLNLYKFVYNCKYRERSFIIYKQTKTDNMIDVSDTIVHRSINEFLDEISSCQPTLHKYVYQNIDVFTEIFA